MPNRIIKESICSSDTVDGLSWFEEVFFYRLIVNCDDFGRMDARTAILKSRLFPLKSITDKQVEDALNKLSTAGIVYLYDVNGRPFLQFVTWENHQQIRARKSKFPAPASTCNQMISNDIKCTRNPIQYESNPNPNPNPNPNTTPAADTITKSVVSPELSKVTTLYMDRIDMRPPPAVISDLMRYTERLTADVVVKAITKADMANARNWPYIEKILRSWEQTGIKTVADVDRLDAEHEAAKASGKSGKVKTAPSPTPTPAQTKEDVEKMREYLKRLKEQPETESEGE